MAKSPVPDAMRNYMIRQSGIVSALVITIAIAASPARCQPSTAGGAERPKYELTIRTKQLEFKVGEVITVEITTKNTSEQPSLAAPALTTAEASYKLDVRDEKGETAPETEYERSFRPAKDHLGREIATVTVVKSGPLRYLQPGETISEQIVLNKLCDVSRPGTYTIEAQSRSGGAGTQKSNRITITIKPEHPK